MASNRDSMVSDPQTELKQIKEDKKALKKQQQDQKKEAKKRAKEIAKREAEIDDDASSISVFLVTVIIVVIWLAILCLLVKLDVGGFGSEVLYPIFKDVPVVNKVLPAPKAGMNMDDDSSESYGGYANLREAVDYIKELELELERAQNTSAADVDRVAELEAEVERLQTFEDSQVEFERIKNEFYEDVVYNDKAPDLEEYKKYYESIDPASAAELYRQVVEQVQGDSTMKDYVQAYTSMKPAEAASIFESMTDDLGLAADILMAMDADSRGKILGKMDPEIAARVTKLMEPE